MAITYKQYKARKAAKRKANIEAVKRANEARKQQAKKRKS